MSSAAKSGIQTTADGTSYIPSSQRADGSTRKEIKVRPGYRPPEDVETYKNRSAEAWKTRGGGGVPGADSTEKPAAIGEAKSKNAKRREAAKKKQDTEVAETRKGDDEPSTIASSTSMLDTKPVSRSQDDNDTDTAAEIERQKKIRNQLKKLRAVRELKDKKTSGEKLTHDQLLKIGKEDELIRDLRKLNYDGAEMSSDTTSISG